MKILFYYDYNSFKQDDLIECFKGLGIKVILTSYQCNNREFDEIFEQKLAEDIKDEHYDFVFSFNYFPAISNVCERINNKVKYVSWIYDSPHLSLYSETIVNSCNYIFHFDRHDYQNYKKIGLKNVFYLPLAVNTDKLDSIICTEAEKTLYYSDVSFVGTLYDKENLYDYVTHLPDYTKGYLEGIMSAQKLIYGYNFLEELLTKPILDEILKHVHLAKTLNIKDSTLLSTMFLGRKVTSMERIDALRMLSEYFYVNLYSTSDPSLLPKVHHKGYVNNEIDMPKVFKQSKINLNLTLRTIQTGIPLRVFDIMGAGGFLITNYQQDLYEFFEEGKDFVVYENLEDLKEKVYYYIEHDNERIAIAKSGYNKVKLYHTFEKRVKELIKIISNE